MEGEDEALLPEVERLLAEHHAFVDHRAAQAGAVRAGGRICWRRRRCASCGAASSIRESRPARPTCCCSTPSASWRRIYRYATVAFIGGTLVPTGGHNPIEPAAAGVPVCFGPSMSNFREIAQVFLRNEAAAEVRDAAEVIEFAATMLDNTSMRNAVGRAGAQHRAAEPRRVGADGAPDRRVAGVSDPAPKPLRARSTAASIASRARALSRAGILQAKRLHRPVISIGNIAAGGAGKTPAVIAVCRFLDGRGLRVAVLTRGYGRARSFVHRNRHVKRCR